MTWDLSDVSVAANAQKDLMKPWTMESRARKSNEEAKGVGQKSERAVGLQCRLVREQGSECEILQRTMVFD